MVKASVLLRVSVGAVRLSDPEPCRTLAKLLRRSQTGVGLSPVVERCRHTGWQLVDLWIVLGAWLPMDRWPCCILLPTFGSFRSSESDTVTGLAGSSRTRRGEFLN